PATTQRLPRPCSGPGPTLRRIEPGREGERTSWGHGAKPGDHRKQKAHPGSIRDGPSHEPGARGEEGSRTRAGCGSAAVRGLFDLVHELFGGLGRGEVPEGHVIADALDDLHDLAGADGRRRVTVHDRVLDL